MNIVELHFPDNILYYSVYYLENFVCLNGKLLVTEDVLDLLNNEYLIDLLEEESLASLQATINNYSSDTFEEIVVFNLDELISTNCQSIMLTSLRWEENNLKFLTMITALVKIYECSPKLNYIEVLEDLNFIRQSIIKLLCLDNKLYQSIEGKDPIYLKVLESIVALFEHLKNNVIIV